MSSLSRPRLGVVVGSTRPGRVGAAVADWFAGEARSHGAFDVEVLDLAKIDLPILDEPNHPRMRRYTKEHTQRWSRLVESMDAFAFVTPEYNYAMAPALLNAIDYLFAEWTYKPVGFVSYGGVSGGTRSVQMAKQVVTSVKMMPMSEGVIIPFVRQSVTDEGRFEPEAPIAEAARTLLDELVRWERALRPLRAGDEARV